MKNTGGRPRKCLVLKADDIPQKAYFTVKEAAEKNWGKNGVYIGIR